MSQELTTIVDKQLPLHREQLEDFIRIPSVSVESFDQSMLKKSANFVADLARKQGFDVEIIELETEDGRKGRPAVLAHKHVGADRPTVLLYGHHDVQPEGTLEGWDQEDPYEPVERNGRLYGRGAADDKAGVMMHFGALEALGDDLNVNVTLFIEGEEEVGSPTFHAFLEKYKDRLESDVMVVADAANWQVGIPALTVMLRGVVRLEVNVRTLNHGIHSGLMGGPAIDAVTAMSHIIASIHDENGDVRVEGLDGWEHTDVDYPEETFRQDASIPDQVQLLGSGSITSTLWTKPHVCVVGMDVTPTSHATNTLAPTCKAYLSLRVAPGQNTHEAGEALARHVKAHAPWGAIVETTVAEDGPGFLVDTSSPYIQVARDAFEEAWGHKSVDIGAGGSIPFVADLAEVFPNAAILITGIEDPDTRAHAHNESLDLGDWRNAILAEALMLKKIGETK
ncbi:dipeptidase [Actinotignum urinale]|uniref:dipeptidase n=1 Tax=Actinotignum urinale TaxID=190146 RepID=UPI0003B4F1E9|nr:dipeptidase [Actinotignum urinale]MDY5129531.1 dipeptidase [Actinotignum urinale]MDY5160880.1 dipeptidase [Actinotignum urinale]WIK59108.1 dipeptidase [Actinotignum urinale]